jgi:hypothetical protein
MEPPGTMALVLVLHRCNGVIRILACSSSYQHAGSRAQPGCTPTMAETWTALHVCHRLTHLVSALSSSILSTRGFGCGRASATIVQSRVKHFSAPTQTHERVVTQSCGARSTGHVGIVLQLRILSKHICLPCTLSPRHQLVVNHSYRSHAIEQVGSDKLIKVYCHCSRDS